MPELPVRASSGARPPPRTRSRAPPARTAAARASGTASARRRARCRNGDSGDVACDFYHRFPDDIALMRELGLDSFRFSIAWPRMLPDGPRPRRTRPASTSTTAWSTRCSRAGIEPCVTLYHWDLPQALEDAGGWPSRATAEAFVEYAEVVARRLGDRVHALDHAQRAVGRVVARLRLGHARARPDERRRRGRRRAPPAALARLGGRRCSAARRRRAEVGITLNLTHAEPASRRRGRRDAAARRRRQLQPLVPRPALPRRVPADLLDVRRPSGTATSRRSRRRSTSSASTTTSASSPSAEPGRPARSRTSPARPYTRHGLGGLPRRASTTCLVRVARDYAPPAIYVTENGAAFGDVRLHDGSVSDPERMRLPRGPPGRGRARDRRRRAGAAATSSGRCSTTSSGRAATRSGSGSSTSTTRRSSASRRASFHWYRDFIAAQRRARRRHGAPRPDALHRARRVRARLRRDAARGRRDRLEGVELFDLHGHARPTCAAWLDEIGLVACGRHAPLDAIESGCPSWRREADELGWRRLVVSWVDPATARRRARRPARRPRPRAARGARPRARLPQPRRRGPRARRRPQLPRRAARRRRLFLELDLGWAWYAGVDPSRSSSAARGRCPLVHVKDFAQPRGRARSLPRRRRRRRLRARGAGGGRGRRRVAARRAGRDGRAAARGRPRARSPRCAGCSGGRVSAPAQRRRRRLRRDQPPVRREREGVRLVRARRLRRPRRGAGRRRWRQAHELPAVSVAELIADPSIDVVLNLTPPPSTPTVIRAGARRRQARLHREAARDRRRRGRRARRRGRARAASASAARRTSSSAAPTRRRGG